MFFGSSSFRTRAVPLHRLRLTILILAPCEWPTSAPKQYGEFSRNGEMTLTCREGMKLNNLKFQKRHNKIYQINLEIEP